jgi:hypothetical protein
MKASGHYPDVGKKHKGMDTSISLSLNFMVGFNQIDCLVLIPAYIV